MRPNGSGRYGKNGSAARDNGYTDGEDGLFIGRNAVTELLKSGRAVDRIYMQKNSGEGPLSVIYALAAKNGVPVVETDVRKLDSLAHGGAHQGVAAVASETDYLSVEDLLQRTKDAGVTPFFLICDSINDPHNLGALIRSANCAGVNGVIIPKRRSAGINGTVAKASAGAVFTTPVARTANLASAVRTLKENGVWIYAAEAGGTPFYECDLTGPSAFILGSEGEGVSDLLKKESDYLIGIPMYGKVNSLNVSVAGGIVMFEAARQRNAKGEVK
ncbi:MAG: 23S rRNA (guanosine(2251)-2'-O)-methyltransferase RlmB [Clostridia bacterium]|nr:23S rRNA (guanosine(2251)-2'-O)-methyltransferase RlmB [Clostridia bacterium]